MLGRAAFRLRPRERARAAANLALAIPEVDSGKRAEILARSAVLLGRNFHDMMAAGNLVGRDDLFREPVGEVRRFGTLDDQLARLIARGRGLILVTGHIGAWELLGARVARLLERRGRGPLAVVTGTVHNPPVDAMLERRRRALGLLPVPRRQGLAPVLRHVRAGGVAAVLLDQNLDDTDPAVPFFGQPAPTPDAVARFAVGRGVPLLPVAMAWDEESGRHVIMRDRVLNEEAALADDKPDQARVDRLHRECQNALESFVRRNPEQWVWFHERWHRKG